MITICCYLLVKQLEENFILETFNICFHLLNQKCKYDHDKVYLTNKDEKMIIMILMV